MTFGKNMMNLWSTYMYNTVFETYQIEFDQEKARRYF